jgi:hypothetical protein
MANAAIMIEAWLREGDTGQGASMTIGDIVVAVQPEGGLPAPSLTRSVAST